MHANVTPEKLRQEIEKHDGMNGLVEQILLAKTIDFLGSNANVEGAPAAPVPAEPNESK
jgi:hypothetical protein